MKSLSVVLLPLVALCYFTGDSIIRYAGPSPIKVEEPSIWHFEYTAKSEINVIPECVSLTFKSYNKTLNEALSDNLIYSYIGFKGTDYIYFSGSIFLDVRVYTSTIFKKRQKVSLSFLLICRNIDKYHLDIVSQVDQTTLYNHKVTLKSGSSSYSAFVLFVLILIFA